MKIVIEENIPFIKGIFEPYAEVTYLAPEAFTPDSVKDADALLVRTRTRCNESLLRNSRCRFIGTATIGTDHIDLDYCHNSGITVASAPGCNAPAVAQYVHATIVHWLNEHDMQPENITLGIVGVGHVGQIVSRWAKHIGMNILECDPPRQRVEAGNFVDLKKISTEADIITFHTPLTLDGGDATYHIGNADFFSSLSRCRLLINSARGPIFDNQALEIAIRNGILKADVSIDCWEEEPRLNHFLLHNTYTATPHIAGYSLQGKHRATEMMIESVARQFNIPINLQPIDMGTTSLPSIDTIARSYNPHIDTRNLRANPEMFEQLRNKYNLRNEC